MSNRDNDVHKVLVTTGNQAVLAAGNSLDALAVGQIGFFDEKTKLSLDATSAPASKIFAAVGVNRNSGTSFEFSAGQNIQVKETESLAFRPHTPGQNQIFDITGFTDAECDCAYSLKFEFRDQEIYRIQGYNQFTRTYVVQSACCVGTQTVQDGNSIAQLFVNAINADEITDRVYTATLVARQALTVATHGVAANLSEGDPLADGDIDALIAFNEANPTAKVYADIRIEVNALPIVDWCNVNLRYFHPRQILIIPSILEDFKCIGAVTEDVQELAFTEGAGYDVQQKEYHSQLNSLGSPYVVLTIPGVAKNNTFFSDRNVNYDQFEIEYDFVSGSGFGSYASAALTTTIAVPATDTVTRNGLAAVIDVLFAGLGFDTLASDVAAANVDPTVLEPTEDKGAADDGIA